LISNDEAVEISRFHIFKPEFSLGNSGLIFEIFLR